MDSQFKEEFKLEVPQERIRKRKKRRSSKAVFKSYDQDQATFLPPSLDEMIDRKHLVRVLNETIGKLNIKPLIESYPGGGTSSYHPEMMLKLLIYAYLNNIYSSRKIAKELRENIYFMWLSGQRRPDFRTINNFRIRLTGVIEEIFVSMVLFLSEYGYVELEKYFLDGSKFRADANRTSYVWKKNTDRYRAAVEQRVKELFRQIDEINNQEDKQYGEKDLPEMGQNKSISIDEIKDRAEQISEKIKSIEIQRDKKKKNNEDKEQKKVTEDKKKTERIIKKIEKEIPKLEKYDKQNEILNGRNSYSHTDHDATFFQMKNKELVPAYSVQIGTENQYIINYSIHQSAADSGLLKSHIEKYRRLFGHYPKLISTDSGYGNEENYEYLDEKGIKNFLKYNTFHYETTKAYIENKYHKDHFPYDKIKDSYQCPQGRQLKFKEEKKTKTKTGYEQTIRVYECGSCRKCPLAKKCKKGKGKRTIHINRQLDYYRLRARENLTTEFGYELRKQRNIDVEPVFGDIKYNGRYQRIRLRGLEKVEIDIGLLSLSHNIKKLALN
jgi:transposase